VELYAELLHCSNMSLLNRPEDKGPKWSKDGCLMGGLTALEELGATLEGDNGDETEGHQAVGEVTPGRELPVSSSSTDCISISSSDEPMSNASMDVDDVEDQATVAQADISLETLEAGPTGLATPRLHNMEVPPTPPPPSDADAARLMDVMASDPRLLRLASAGVAQSETASVSNVAVASTSAVSVVASEDQTGMEQEPSTVHGPLDDEVVPVGSRLKRKFVQANVMETVVVGVPAVSGAHVDPSFTPRSPPSGPLLRVPVEQLSAQRRLRHCPAGPRWQVIPRTE
jgi:hypothetical protein